MRTSSPQRFTDRLSFLRVFVVMAIAAVVTGCGNDGGSTGPKLKPQPSVLRATGSDPVSGASLTTDLDDYVPGEIVHLVGAGWAPGETIHLDMSEEPDTHPDVTMDVQADSAGAFSVHFYDVQAHDLGVTFTLVGTGGTSGSTATVVFTDGTAVLSIAAISPSSPAPGAALSANLSVAFNGCNVSNPCPNWKATRFSIDALSAVCVNHADFIGGTGANHTETLSGVATTLTAPGAGAHTLHAQAFTDDACTSSTGGIKDFNFSVGSSNTPPVLTAIGDKTIDEATAFTFTATATDGDTPAQTLTFSLDAGAPAGAAITSGGVFTWTPTEAQGPGSYPVTIRVTDNGSPAMDDFEAITITVSEVNVAPVLASIGNQTVSELSLLTFTATATDADVPANALTFSLDAGAPSGAGITSAGVFTWTPTEAQGPGDYSVTVRVTDNGDPAKDDFETISIHVDEVNVAPVLASIGNKSIKEGSPLTFTATATDADLPANTLTFSLDAGAPAGASITSAGDFSWTPADGPASATITIRVTDDGVPALDAYETITVTVNNVAPTLNTIAASPTLLAVGGSTTLTLGFSDPAGTNDSYTAWVNWDDGLGYVNAGSIANGGGTKTHTYNAAGVYTICARIDDEDSGQSNSKCVLDYVVVYDPSAGFVTGGGWINSKAGDYKLDLTLAGKATFGFVSKYSKGANSLTGNTEFQFHEGSLNFSSTSYQWLVVSGAQAQYKGAGTVNGVAGYEFILSAWDGQVSGGGGVDKFRIKITRVSDNTLIYDNQGGTDDAAPTTAISGGSIVVHK